MSIKDADEVGGNKGGLEHEEAEFDPKQTLATLQDNELAKRIKNIWSFITVPDLYPEEKARLAPRRDMVDTARALLLKYPECHNIEWVPRATNEDRELWMKYCSPDDDTFETGSKVSFQTGVSSQSGGEVKPLRVADKEVFTLARILLFFKAVEKLYDAPEIIQGEKIRNFRNFMRGESKLFVDKCFFCGLKLKPGSLGTLLIFRFHVYMIYFTQQVPSVLRWTTLSKKV